MLAVLATILGSPFSNAHASSSSAVVVESSPDLSGLNNIA